VSTGLVYPSSVFGGLDRPPADLINAVWLDVEAHQTMRKADSREFPQRSEYELIQVAAVIEEKLGTSDSAEYMRCVLFCVCCSNCPVAQHTYPSCAFLDCVDASDFCPRVLAPSAFAQSWLCGLGRCAHTHLKTTLCSAQRVR